jgi:hypothetical protein
MRNLASCAVRYKNEIAAIEAKPLCSLGKRLIAGFASFQNSLRTGKKTAIRRVFAPFSFHFFSFRKRVQHLADDSLLFPKQGMFVAITGNLSKRTEKLRLTPNNICPASQDFRYSRNI